MAAFSFNNHLKSYWLDWNWGEQNLETQRRCPAKYSTGFWETGTNFATVRSDGTCLCAGGNWRLQPSTRATCSALLGQYCQEWQARWKEKTFGLFFFFYRFFLPSIHSNNSLGQGKPGNQGGKRILFCKVLLPTSQRSKQKSQYGAKK